LREPKGGPVAVDEPVNGSPFSIFGSILQRLLDYQYNLVQVMNLGFSKATQQQQKNTPPDYAT